MFVIFEIFSWVFRSCYLFLSLHMLHFFLSFEHSTLPSRFSVLPHTHTFYLYLLFSYSFTCCVSHSLLNILPQIHAFPYPLTFYLYRLSSYSFTCCISSSLSNILPFFISLHFLRSSFYLNPVSCISPLSFYLSTSPSLFFLNLPHSIYTVSLSTSSHIALPLYLSNFLSLLGQTLYFFLS